MRMLLLSLILLIPTLSFAQSLDSRDAGPPSGNRNVTVYRQQSGIDYYTDHQGTTGRVYHNVPGMSFYSFQGPNGERQQGHLYEPMPESKPLTPSPHSGSLLDIYESRR
jgi:hypothetical protein